MFDYMSDLSDVNFLHRTVMKILYTVDGEFRRSSYVSGVEQIIAFSLVMKANLPVPWNYRLYTLMAW